MRKLLIFGIFWIVSCQEKASNQQSFEYLNLVEFSKSVVDHMHHRSADVAKIFILNDQSETRLINKTDSAFWAKELELLRKTDLTAPKYLGSLEISEQNKDNNSNLLFDRITTTEEAIDLKSVEVFYLDDRSQIRMLQVEYATDNFISTSHNHLTIWFNEYDELLLVDSLISIGSSKILFQGERYYESRIRRIRQ